MVTPQNLLPSRLFAGVLRSVSLHAFVPSFTLALALTLGESRGASIGLNFGAGSNTSAAPSPVAMGASEMAGLVPQTNWNSFGGPAVQATPQPLVLDDGTSSGTTVTWSSSALWDTSANSSLDGSPGDARMMLGYLDTSDSSVTTVTISGVPASFQASGYRVIIYYDGENNGNNRVGAYTLNGVTLYARDAGNSVFTGLYAKGQSSTAPTGAQDNNSAGALQIPAGNYIEFTNLTAASLTLTARASVSSDTINRAPVNGIQIIANPASTPMATTQHVLSPDGTVDVLVSDQDGLSYSVNVDGNPVVTRSALGLVFGSGTLLGPGTTISSSTFSSIDDSWTDSFGPNRDVKGGYNEGHFILTSKDGRTFGLYMRAYNNGVAFRYEIPTASGLGSFTITNELSQFAFGGNWNCRIGTPSNCDESTFPAQSLSNLGSAYQGVVPLLVQTQPAGVYVSVTESDLWDWAGMWIQGTVGGSAQVNLSMRSDGNGMVVSTTPRNSPWRVLMLARASEDLLRNELVATLARPSMIADTSWIHPGACAWDPWWTGVNAYDGTYTGLQARGNTQSDKDYIDFAAQMGWPYQMMDWDWYNNGDFNQVSSSVDIPGLISYAASKGVKLLIWAHSNDVKKRGVTSSLDLFKSYGFAGVKVDFFNSQSQETVQYVDTLVQEAAARQMLVDCHGMYHPSGLARTWPNFITQEGVRGNEYNKIDKTITSDHETSLALTRATLGPMDFTPGGFRNRYPSQFSVTYPALVQVTRARELALPVIYPSPLTVFCDSPASYAGQSGLDFLKSFPTVWDKSAILTASLTGNVAVARQSGATWRIGVLGVSSGGSLNLNLGFLGTGQWELTEYADSPVAGAAATDLSVGSRVVAAGDTLTVNTNQVGGYAGILRPLPSGYFSGWQSGDIGSVAATGSFSTSGGTINIAGSGADIWGTTDAFRFAWQAAFGDCEIVARLTSVGNTDPSAKAGLMIRDALNSNSAFAMNLMTPGNVNAMEARSSAGAQISAYTANAPSASIPRWLRLTRAGNVFTSYYGSSATGPWTVIGSATVTMGNAVFIGLGITSHADGTLCNAMFDNVSISATPLTPVGVAAAAAANGGVQLSWSSVTLADSYEIRRAASPNGSYSLIATGVGSPSYIDSTAAPGATSFYTIRAVNAHGSSSDSAPASATAYTQVQVWRMQNFGQVDSSGNAADTADPDHDGRSNLLEYAMGSDPQQPDAAPSGVFGKSPDGQHLTLTFTGIADPALTYTVEAADSPTSPWTSIWTSTGASNTAGPITVTDPELTNAHSSRFLRLKVSL
jgi:alpha-glucosidase